MTCEACGGELERDSVELAVGEGRSRTIAQAGWYCLRCGTARFTAKDLYEAERQLRLAEPPEPLRVIAGTPPAKAA